jgi:hypothetical protein
MSLFLDVFILLDTVRTVLCGVSRSVDTEKLAQSEAVQKWERLKQQQAPSKMELGAA